MSKPVVICVDDEKIVLDSLKSQLKKALKGEYELEIAESGEEALEILEELQEDSIEVPLVISDQIMPGLKGDEFLVEINDRTPKTLKILLTGQASADAVGNAVNKARLYRYISKPWDEQDLSLTVHEAIKSYFQSKKLEDQNKQLEDQNKQLEDANELLEYKVQKRTEEVVLQKELVEKKNNDILASINYAKRIQAVMLPEESILEEKVDDFFIFFRPRDGVSGDFYWFDYTENNKLIITAVDCTGHGVPGAIMSMIGLEQLTEIVNIFKVTEPNKILERLHLSVRKILKQEIGENRDGMDISLCVIDKEAKKIEFAGAKNPLVYIQKDENGEPQLHKIKGDINPIGGYQQEAKRNFTNHEISFKDPTCLYLFSDGYQDQFGGEKNRKFMIKRMKNLLLEIHEKPMNEQKKILEETLDDWMEGYSQIDDILVMGIKI